MVATLWLCHDQRLPLLIGKERRLGGFSLLSTLLANLFASLFSRCVRAIQLHGRQIKQSFVLLQNSGPRLLKRAVFEPFVEVIVHPIPGDHIGLKELFYW